MTAPNGAQVRTTYSPDGNLWRIDCKENSDSDWITYAEFSDYTAAGHPQQVRYPIPGISNRFGYLCSGAIQDQAVELNQR